MDRTSSTPRAQFSTRRERPTIQPQSHPLPRNGSSLPAHNGDDTTGPLPPDLTRASPELLSAISTLHAGVSWSDISAPSGSASNNEPDLRLHKNGYDPYQTNQPSTSHSSHPTTKNKQKHGARVFSSRPFRREEVIRLAQKYSAWRLETISSFLSFISLIVIILVLQIYDGKPLPSMPLGISLNTLLAFLATFARATLMVPVSEALSQWKWNRFQQRDKPLPDFALFDESSRGLWGSTILLTRLRWKHIATLGALVTALGIFTSPITQQAVAYPTRKVATTSTATVPANWNSPSLDDQSPRALLGGSNSIQSGIFGALAPEGGGIAPACPTANCTFPRFHTLGVCSSTADITHLLNITFLPKATPANWTSYLPTGENPDQELGAYNLSLPLPGAYIVTPVPHVLYSFPINESLAFRSDESKLAAAVIDIVAIYSTAPNGTYPMTRGPGAVDPGFRAMEIVHYMCVKELEVWVDSGVSHTEVVSSTYNMTETGPSHGFKFKCILWEGQPDGLVNCNWQLVRPSDMTLTATVDGVPRNFSVGKNILDDFGSSLFPIMLGGFGWDGVQLSWERFGQNHAFITALFPPEDRELSVEEQYQGMANASDRIAATATNVIRTIPPLKPGEDNSFLIKGTAWIEETYIHVRWEWLTFLAAQIVLGVAFLAFTIVHTSRSGVMVLKSSPLAALFALDSRSREIVGSVSGTKEMTERAKHLTASLVGSGLVASEKNG